MNSDDRMKPRQAIDLHDLEQSIAVMGDMFPPLWRKMYTRSIEEGFTEEQAFALVQTYILSGAVQGVNGTGR
ncbi:hypothetical protein LCGC14_1275260 [marine sediment metagenome]|uniref:Uncharacterized protein n=1 Tax=marine sediment metagenome TaxID=412755 RepID=A0A0F9NDK6_9ZZZZ